MHTTSSLVPRSEPTDSAATHSNSSVFTFLIALLILLCTSAAVVLRAVLMRRRFRRRVQNALDAGILLPTRPLAENKPEMWEVWVRGAKNVRDWDALQPVCVTKVPDNTTFDEKAPPRNTISYRSPPVGRLMQMLGHPPTPPSVNLQQAEPAKEPSKSSTVQVVVLIAMPSPQLSIPPDDQSSTPSSLKGKDKDAHDDADADTDEFPDVMFGISTFVSPRLDDHES